jgi:23S rRNA (cytosine1962-C5)-methyltransferase
VDQNERTSTQAEMLANRVRKTAKKLRKWAEQQGITCYRIYDRDIPEIPLCIDWYAGRLHIAEYARRTNASMSTAEHEQWLDLLINASAAALDVDRAEIFIKRRQRQRGSDQYERFDSRGATFKVAEGGLTFEVNLSDYLDTGLFLDHRLTRELVRREARGKRVLNLFAYTGSFTVYAAHGGARATTTVDLSQSYLDWTSRNLELNHLNTPRHRLIQADVLRFLWEPARKFERYDLAVVDPPTFSNSKRMSSHFDILEHHPNLLRRVFELMAPEGVVYFSTNARRFRLDEQSLGQTKIEDISEATIPEDFRDQRIHRCFRLRPAPQGRIRYEPKRSTPQANTSQQSDGDMKVREATSRRGAPGSARGRASPTAPRGGHPQKRRGRDR